MICKDEVEIALHTATLAATFLIQIVSLQYGLAYSVT